MKRNKEIENKKTKQNKTTPKRRVNSSETTMRAAHVISRSVGVESAIHWLKMVNQRERDCFEQMKNDLGLADRWHEDDELRI